MCLKESMRATDRHMRYGLPFSLINGATAPIGGGAWLRNLP